MSEELKFRQKTTECCLVYNYKKQLMGEIRKRRIGYFKQWCFQPNTVQRMGDTWYTKSFIEQILEMMKTLRKRGFCVKQDMNYEEV